MHHNIEVCLVVSHVGMNCLVWLVDCLPKKSVMKQILSSQWCHPDTEIFSKRRKIYSICVDGWDTWLMWQRRDQTLPTYLGPSHKLFHCLSWKKFCRLKNLVNQDVFLPACCQQAETPSLLDWNISNACSRISFHGKVLTLNCGSLEPGCWKSGQSNIRLSLLGLLAKIKV